MGGRVAPGLDLQGACLVDWWSRGDAPGGTFCRGLGRFGVVAGGQTGGICPLGQGKAPGGTGISALLCGAVA